MDTDTPPSPPSPKMTGLKAALSYGFAIVFDFLKLIFNFLIFTGPYIAGIAAEMYARSQGWPDWLSSTMFYLVGGSTVAAEIFVPQIAFLVGALGAIFATVIGIMGSLFMFLWFLLVCRTPLWRKGGLYLRVDGLRLYHELDTVCEHVLPPDNCHVGHCGRAT